MKHINKLLVLSSTAFLLASCGPKNVTAEKAEEVAKGLKFEDTKVTKVELLNGYSVKEATVIGNTLLEEMKKQYGEDGKKVELDLDVYEDEYFVSNFEFDKRGDENYTYVLDNTAITVDGTISKNDKGVTIGTFSYNLTTTLTEHVVFNSQGNRTQAKYTYTIKNAEADDTILDFVLYQTFYFSRASSSSEK